MNTEITREDIIEYKKNFLNINEELDKEKLNAEIYMPLMKMINDSSLQTYLIIGEKPPTSEKNRLYQEKRKKDLVNWSSVLIHKEYGLMSYSHFFNRYVFNKYCHRELCRDFYDLIVVGCIMLKKEFELNRMIYLNNWGFEKSSIPQNFLKDTDYNFTKYEEVLQYLTENKEIVKKWKNEINWGHFYRKGKLGKNMIERVGEKFKLKIMKKKDFCEIDWTSPDRTIMIE